MGGAVDEGAGADSPFVAEALTRAESAGVLTSLRAAVRWKWSPARPWGVSETTDEAVVLGVALQLYEDGLCGGCGHPFSETSDDERAEAYAVEERMCNVCMLLESKRDQKKNPPAGWKLIARRLFQSEIKPSQGAARRKARQKRGVTHG